VFVQDFKTVDRPYHEVASTLTSETRAILELALAATKRESDRFRIGVAPIGWPASLAESMAVQPGPVRAQPVGILMAFTWQALVGASLFPRLDADLDVTPFGQEQTTVTLRGRLTIWPALVDGRQEEFLILRLAESINRAFLNGVCASLCSPARPTAVVPALGR
jgi:hypothetical protein